MEWVQVLAIIGGNLGIILPLFLWLRSEGNSDRRETQNILREDRRDFLKLVSEIKNDAHEFRLAMQDEIKDFHHRLIEIEKSRK